MAGGSTLSLQVLASCFNGSSIQVDFSWENSAVIPHPCWTSATSPAPLTLAEPRKRNLQLDTDEARVCVSYQLTVTGCMRNTTICSNKSIDVELITKIPGNMRQLGGQRWAEPSAGHMCVRGMLLVRVRLPYQKRKRVHFGLWADLVIREAADLGLGGVGLIGLDESEDRVDPHAHLPKVAHLVR